MSVRFISPFFDNKPKCYTGYTIKHKFNVLFLCVSVMISFGSSLQGSSSKSSSFDVLIQKAQQCRQQVDELWQHHKQLPREQRRDFHIAIGYASKHCDDLRDIVKQLDKAKALSEAYEKSFQEAQNIIPLSRDTL